MSVEHERRYRALLLGNWDFPADPVNLPPLRGPRVDVTLLERALTDETRGLHRPEDVAVLENRTAQEMRWELERFITSAARTDQILVYYSGHGLQIEHGSDLYLCARDSTRDAVWSTTVSALELERLLSTTCDAAAKIVVLDCCYSGNYGFKGGADGSPFTPGHGFVVLASSPVARRSPDALAEGEPSPFTGHVVAALLGGARDRTGNGYVTTAEVSRYAHERLFGSGKPLPTYSQRLVGNVAMARSLADPRAAPASQGAPTSGASTSGAASPGVSTSGAPAGPGAVEATTTPLDADASANRFAAAMRRQGTDPAMARREYKIIAESGSGDWRSLAGLWLATMSVDDGDRDTAVAAYRQVVAADHPEWSPEAGYELGALCLSADDIEGALAAWRYTAHHHHPRWSPRAARRLGHLLVRQRDIDAGLRYYRQAAYAEHPEAAEAAVELGDVLRAVGRHDEARAMHRRAALANNPDQSAPGGRSVYRRTDARQPLPDGSVAAPHPQGVRRRGG